MASLATVFYKNDLHSDFDIQRHIFNLIPWILLVSLHLLSVFFCHHNACAAASDITVTSTPNRSIWILLWDTQQFYSGFVWNYFRWWNNRRKKKTILCLKWQIHNSRSLSHAYIRENGILVLSLNYMISYMKNKNLYRDIFSLIT